MSVGPGLCDGRVVIVTGAGRGLGRAHALALARAGALVVVNDVGTSREGEGSGPGPAQRVVDEITALGGRAVADTSDVSDWDEAAQLVEAALSAFGGLDALVNNAGFLRDRMIVSMDERSWDAVVRVHLKGQFCTTRHAAAYWRRCRKRGQPVDARVINTTSGAGLAGSVGQANYAAAKAGVAAFTLVAAAELGRYGVTVNAIAPAARTRMTEVAMPDLVRAPDTGFDGMAPENVSPLVVWLASAAAHAVTGRVFEVSGGAIGVADGWRSGPTVRRDARWDPEAVGPAVAGLLSQAARPVPVHGTPADGG